MKLTVCLGKSNQLVRAIAIAWTIVITCPSVMQAQQSSEGLLPPPLPPGLSPASTPITQPLTPVDSSATAYALGGGDNIRIDILEVPQYSGAYLIPADGAISLPLVGRIQLQGLTIEQASQTISNAYKEFLNYPVVTVTLVTPRPINILVAGEVNRPGSYAIALNPGVGNAPGVQYPTITQAIEKAGGITLTAEMRKIELRRQRLSGTLIIKVDLRKMLETGDRTQDVLLQDGDSIFIPTLTNVNIAETRKVATSSFSAGPDTPRTVAVVGEVTHPGSYVIVGGNTGNDQSRAGLPTVTRALQLAGGVKPLANLRQIQVRRINKANTEQIITVNLWQLLQIGDFSQDAVLQDGDTIIVPTIKEINPVEAATTAASTFASGKMTVYVVGEAGRAAYAQISLDVPTNTPLNQVLLASGGFNTRADREEVELIRLNPNGTVARRKVKVDFSQGINEKTNPIMQSNDIILVSRSTQAAFYDQASLTINGIGLYRPLLQGVEDIFTIFGLIFP